MIKSYFVKSMFFRFIFSLGITTFFFLSTCFFSFTAEALVPIKLIDISYKDCPAELSVGNVTSGGQANPASCYLVTGKTQNTSGKTLYDADVFGRIYGANNEPALQNRSRVGSIEQVLPGEHEFEIRISVPSDLPIPLKLKQFKATGFSSKVYPTF